MSLLTGGLTHEELDKNVVHRVTIGHLRPPRNGSVAPARGYPRAQPTALLYLVAASRGVRPARRRASAGPLATRPLRLGRFEDERLRRSCV